jgi:DNA-binding GntR family transcriptional regulator
MTVHEIDNTVLTTLRDAATPLTQDDFLALFELPETAVLEALWRLMDQGLVRLTNDRRIRVNEAEHAVAP